MGSRWDPVPWLCGPTTSRRGPSLTTNRLHTRAGPSSSVPGVQAIEAQKTANDAGYVVVEGDCPTLGIAGGYTQGGGTSPLGSKFGLAADQVLEWEVVTADGTFRTASPTKNTDLYWALPGGGGGTYGAVLSMTVKLYKNLPTGGATLTFVDSTDAYWKAVQAVLVNLPAVLRAGETAYWQNHTTRLHRTPWELVHGSAILFASRKRKERQEAAAAHAQGPRRDGRHLR